MGAAWAVAGGTSATWTWTDTPGLHFSGPDDRLVRAVDRHLRRCIPDLPAGAEVSCTGPWPPACGLKTSSSAAAALLLAAHDALDLLIGPARLVAEAVAVSRAAGVTLTGALDDQLAVVHGGARLADNLQSHDLGPLPAPGLHVALWIPEQGLEKSRVRHVDLDLAVPGAREAEWRLRAGDLLGVVAANHRAYATAHAAAGLPVPEEAVGTAKSAGALAAGMTGTGPAAFALFEAPRELPSVAGGRWSWTRTAYAPARTMEAPA